MNLNKKFAAAGICVGMSAFLLSGCSSTPKKLDPNATVATMGDTKLTLGVVNLMFRYSQTQTGAYIRMLLGDDGTNIWEQDLVGSGTPYGQTLKESALSEYEKMVLLEQHMDDFGVSVTDEEKAKITEAAEAFLAANSQEVLDQMTATQETVERLLTLYTIEDKMQAAIKSSAEVEITDEEAAQKGIRYAYFAIPEPEEETETEAVTEAASEAESASEAVTEEASETESASEAVTEAVSETETTTEAVSEEETEEGFEETAERTQTREAVQGIVDEINGGKDMEEAVKAYDETKNIINNHYGVNSSTLSQTLVDAAETLTEEGQATLVETENGFYVLQLTDLLDEEATAEEKADLEEERRSEYFSETLEGWEPEDFTVDEKVWATINYADDFRMPEAETEEETAGLEEETSEAAAEITEAASETESTSEAGTEAVTETATEAASETESEA